MTQKTLTHLPATLLTQEEAAKILNLSPSTLMKWRSIGRGPRFIKVGRLPRYPLDALQRWIDTRAVGGEGQ